MINEAVNSWLWLGAVRHLNRTTGNEGRVPADSALAGENLGCHIMIMTPPCRMYKDTNGSIPQCPSAKEDTQPSTS